MQARCMRSKLRDSLILNRTGYNKGGFGMKNYLWKLCLVLSLFVGVALYAEDVDDDDLDVYDKLELEERELELQERRSELNFQQEMRKIKLDKMHQGNKGNIHSPSLRFHGKPHRSSCSSNKKLRVMKILCPLFLMLIISLHILLAVWVYKDIRNKDSESGIWIIIALVAGLPGVAVYAIVRLGNKN